MRTRGTRTPNALVHSWSATRDRRRAPCFPITPRSWHESSRIWIPNFLGSACFGRRADSCTIYASCVIELPPHVRKNDQCRVRPLVPTRSIEQRVGSGSDLMVLYRRFGLYRRQCLRHSAPETRTKRHRVCCTLGLSSKPSRSTNSACGVSRRVSQRQPGAAS